MARKLIINGGAIRPTSLLWFTFTSFAQLSLIHCHFLLCTFSLFWSIFDKIFPHFIIFHYFYTFKHSTPHFLSIFSTFHCIRVPFTTLIYILTLPTSVWHFWPIFSSLCNFQQNPFWSPTPCFTTFFLHFSTFLHGAHLQMVRFCNGSNALSTKNTFPVFIFFIDHKYKF